jgi:hypothetical protein
MRRVDDLGELGWLQERAGSDSCTGYDPDGWSASVWVLHAMYENPSMPDDITHHEARQQLLAAGLAQPLIIGHVNLDAVAITTGASLGRTADPGPGWTRLRWRDLAARLGSDLGDNDYPPCHRWFPYTSWPISIRPPGEGSLDRESYLRLVALLGRFSRGPDAECWSYYSPVANGLTGGHLLYEGRFDELAALYDAADVPGSPSNIWPADRSWLVYTDCDLWATRVSGPVDLVNALRVDDLLEVVEWQRP